MSRGCSCFIFVVLHRLLSCPLLKFVQRDDAKEAAQKLIDGAGVMLAAPEAALAAVESSVNVVADDVWQFHLATSHELQRLIAHLRQQPE